MAERIKPPAVEWNPAADESGPEQYAERAGKRASTHGLGADACAQTLEATPTATIRKVFELRVIGLSSADLHWYWLDEITDELLCRTIREASPATVAHEVQTILRRFRQVCPKEPRPEVSYKPMTDTGNAEFMIDALRAMLNKL